MKYILLLLTLLACDSCYLPSLPLSRRDVASSTFAVYTTKGDHYSQGTAWVVADGYLLTAGHVCAESTAVAVRTPSGLSSATWVAWEMSRDESGDLCLIRWAGAHGPLPLAEHMPAPGAEDGYIGYPHGEYVEQSGNYTKGNESSTSCTNGASGSAMFTKDGVYGVVVAYDWFGSCFVTPLSEVRAFLHQNKVELP